jgi:hypothetical protein
LISGAPLIDGIMVGMAGWLASVKHWLVGGKKVSRRSLLPLMSAFSTYLPNKMFVLVVPSHPGRTSNSSAKSSLTG